MRAFFVFGGRNAAAFFIFGRERNCTQTAPKLRFSCPVVFIPQMRKFLQKGALTVEEMIAELARIGMPDRECRRIRAEYRDDLEGLAMYVLYMRAILDDRHEYV